MPALPLLSATFKDPTTGDDVKVGGILLASIHKQLLGRGITTPVEVLDEKGKVVGWATSDSFGGAGTEPKPNP